MSYRSFKRVLGETSLERKRLLLFGIVALLLVACIAWWHHRSFEQLAYAQFRARGRLLVDTVLTRVHWQGLEGTPDGSDFASMLGASLEQQSFNWTTIRPNSANPKHRPANAMEQSILASLDAAQPPPFEAGASDRPTGFYERHDAEAGTYLYYQPVRAREPCVVCHRQLPDADKTLAEGNLISVVKIELPDRSLRASLARDRAMLLFLPVGAILLTGVAAYLAKHFLVLQTGKDT